MGPSLSVLAWQWLGKVPSKIVMVGLAGAGKTTVLYKLHPGENVGTSPTLGFNVEKVRHKNLLMAIWDVGGQGVWRYHYQDLRGFIFVIDSTDRERFEDAANELEAALQNAELRGVPLLVYANKQDAPSAAPAGDIRHALRLDKLGARPWHIQGCSAVRGDGLSEGLDWLVERVRRGPTAA